MRVLLIGNSQMQTFDLPRMLEVITAAAPAEHPRLDVGRAVLSGKSLRDHWEVGETDGSPRAMIAAGNWDKVVIQEIFSAQREDFERYATLFDEAIRLAGAETVLFATASVTHYYRSSCRYPESFQALNDMQLAFGQKHAIPVAAAGYTWMRYLGENPKEEQLLDLYHPDRGHPGKKGTYLYACLLYAHLSGKSPEGLVSEFPDIHGGVWFAEEEARRMQQAAWAQYRVSSLS